VRIACCYDHASTQSKTNKFCTRKGKYILLIEREGVRFLLQLYTHTHIGYTLYAFFLQLCWSHAYAVVPHTCGDEKRHKVYTQCVCVCTVVRGTELPLFLLKVCTCLFVYKIYSFLIVCLRDHNNKRYAPTATASA
jgi:hypothetical protein